MTCEDCERLRKAIEDLIIRYQEGHIELGIEILKKALEGDKGRKPYK